MQTEIQLPIMDTPDLQSRTSGIDTRLLRGELRQHEPMKRHVSWRAGGHAACFYQPADLEDLALFYATGRKMSRLS